MKQSITVIVAVWAAWTLSSTAAAATMGEQSFHLLFKAGDVVWIGEDIGGEYELSVLHQVAITKDGILAGQSELRAFRHWSPIRDLKPHFRIASVLELKPDADKRWTHPDLSWTIQPPAEKPSLAEAFDRHVRDGGSHAGTFYAQQNAPPEHPPVIIGADAEPLYYSGRGLFFNYTLEAAWFFPRSGLLLVFTRQPIVAVGLDTMHGFVVMRLNTPSLSRAIADD